ncbi:hypothetical protein IPN35_05675 [Candidatus Peregrinibacteria bacterium]|nr:MAG: hypothetical protein IPN35_05675 [Candidatus Peregrinibacteria bacterium]
MENTKEKIDGMPPEEKEGDVTNNSDVAGLCYFLVFAPLIYYRRKDSPFIQFHARQANVLFLVTIFFAILPGKLSWLLLLSLAMAVTGILQANMGKWWKMPIVAELLESGLSYNSAKEKGKRGVLLFQRALNLQKKSGENPSRDSQRIQFLEEQLLRETRLRKQQISKLSSEQQRILNILSKIQKPEEEEYLLVFRNEGKTILIGGFSEEGMELFANKEVFFGAEHLESFSGEKIRWEDAENRISEIFYEVFSKKEINTEVDSPVPE